MEPYENMTSSGGFNETTSAPEKDPLPFENFAPTLAQCFFIVLAGYFVGKAQLLSASDLRGVTSFAAYFAMPGIICISLADADLGNLEWQLLVGTVAGKAVIFAIVAVSTTLLTQPSDVSMAGMFAMFCVQCNDLPVGNPLMSSLYGEVRPYMLKYLFLLPALTILFFSPICHIMMETTNRKGKRLHNGISRTNSKTSVYSRMSDKIRAFFFNKMTREIVLNLLKSPVIIATFLGIVLNVAFRAHVPSVLHQPINVVATMIPGLALSVLGFSMLGKEKHLFSSGIVLGSVLIAVKMVLTPIVLYSCVKLLVDNQHKEMLDFSLLYGIISPAAIIFQFGEKYRLPVAAMSAALILSSFTCFPLSYVIAKLSFVKNHDLNYYIPRLRFILLFVAIVSLLCCLAVWTTFIWKKRWGKPPCCYVFYMAFTQVWMSSGVVLWQISDNSHPWTLYGQVILACGGEIATYIWTGILSVALVLQQNYPSALRSNSVVLLLSGFGLSIVVTIVLCLLVFNEDFSEVMLFGQPRHNYEYLQLATTTATLAICLIVVGTCLVLYFKRKGSAENFKGDAPVPPEPQAEENGVYKINLSIPESHANSKRISNVSTASTITSFNEQDEKTLYYDEVIKTGEMEKSMVFGARWTFRHISLLTLLWTTMAIKLLANIAKLIDCKTTSVTVPLEYLQAVLFTGQGVWTFLTFGVDIRTTYVSIIKWWRKVRYGKEVVVTDPAVVESEEVQRVCLQFRTFFYDHSFQELAKERVWKKHHYRKSFWGHQMVNYLIKAGLAKDELEAEEYGQNLLLGGVISHVRNIHYFHDAPYLYYFLKSK